MPPIVLYEENRTYVIEKFHNGHFDYIDMVLEAPQRAFFRFVTSSLLLERLAQSYPWPRTKQEVPSWLFVASDMAMRLHGNHAFQGYPWVIRTGGMLSAFGPKLGTRHIDQATGEVHIECQGFNRKNDYPRQTPCDPDFLRKIAKDTPAQQQMRWFNEEVQKIFRRHRFFDKAGIFLGDGSYIFVPDNAHEGPVFWEMLDEFVSVVGQEVIKELILDRGFLDGEAIAETKTRYGIDVTIGVRRNMNVLEDAWGILSTAGDEQHAVPALQRYHLRVLIEERHRHLKCFWDLSEFTSPCFALVVNQIIFTALTYSLLQQQILRQARKALNKASKSRMMEELVPTSDQVIVYTDHYYAAFDKLEYTDMVLAVPESARGKLRELIRRKQSRTRLAIATDASP